MRTLALLLLLIMAPAHAAFDRTVVQGQWGAYASHWFGPPQYYFLAINEDYSGVLVRNFGDKEVRRTFSAADVTFRDGYFEVALGSSEKAVFSAWKLPSGVGRLTGQIFMFKKGEELYNMLYFPLELLTPGHDLLGESEIRTLSDEFNAHR